MNASAYELTEKGREYLTDDDAPIPFCVTPTGLRYLRRQRIREAMSMRSNLHDFIPFGLRDFFCMWPSNAFKRSNNYARKWWASTPHGKCWVRR